VVGEKVTNLTQQTPQIVLALDVGTKRIGVAVGDTRFRIPRVLPALANDADLWENLAKLIQQEQADVLVLGRPRNNNGEPTAQTHKIEQFADELKQHIQLPLAWSDESLTSVRAEEIMRARPHFTESLLRDGHLDSEAAALFLSDYLENQAAHAEVGRG
jgi:putative Holliday junction resolvase